MDKKEEQIIGNFFIKKINSHYGLNYKINPNNNEQRIDGDIDLYAKNSKETLNIQITVFDGILRKEYARLFKEAKRNKMGSAQGKVFDLKTDDWAIIEIEKKGRKYPDKNKKDLILLVSGNSNLYNINYAQNKFSKVKGSEFKGIYFVILPMPKERSNHPNGGQIIVIKSIFNDNIVEL